MPSELTRALAMSRFSSIKCCMTLTNIPAPRRANGQATTSSGLDSHQNWIRIAKEVARATLRILDLFLKKQSQTRCLNLECLRLGLSMQTVDYLESWLSLP